MEEVVTDGLHQVEKNRNKKRFNDEQIKSLESIFETESKLQSWKKVQIAKELGLHPKQVAIWFQNKRARWKSKQLEHDYDEMKAGYDSLLSKFDILKNEKQSLLSQLQALRDRLGQNSKRVNTDSDRVNEERLDFTRDGPETPVLGGECVNSFRNMEREDWNIPKIPDLVNGYFDLQERWDDEHWYSFSETYESLLLEKT